MKRSRVNDIMAAADDMIRQYGFVLPPFANWSPTEFKAKAHRARRVIEGRCGWDITDYGQGALTIWGCFCSPCATANWLICSAAAGCAMPKNC